MPMNLEDHLGDIIRKARSMSSVTPDAAAKAAGLTVPELDTLEKSGTISKKPNFAALAPVLGLNAAKLEKLANGWLPAAQDLSLWRELRVCTTIEEDTSVNAFLVWDEVSREAAIFDTGWDAAPLLKIVGDENLQLRHVFITHTHPDHMAGLGAIRAAFPKVRVHTNSKTAPPEQRIRPNDFIMLGSLRVTNRDTPGHAEDGVTYIIGNWSEDAPHVAVAGDAIFAGSMGRGNDSWELARQKVRDQILTLPPDTLICPGHGPLTTVGEEKANNPFF